VQVKYNQACHSIGKGDSNQFDGKPAQAACVQLCCLETPQPALLLLLGSATNNN